VTFAIRITLFVGALLLGVVGAASAPSYARPNAAGHPKWPHLSAITPLSGDLDPDHDPRGVPSALPAPVEATVRRLTYRHWKRYLAWRGTAGSATHLRDFLGPIIRIPTPQHLDLYIFEEADPVDCAYYDFILYNPRTKQATAKPPYIYAKWMPGEDWGEPLERPLISFKDIDGDGSEELVVRERVHNGTVYNGVMTHYYALTSDCALRQMVAVETRVVVLAMSGPVREIHRALLPVGRNELKLTAVLKDMETGRPDTLLGEVVLRRKSPSSPVQVATKRAFVEGFKDELITSNSDEDENAMLRNGYRGYY
jgi:hypothetical protein